MCDFGWHFFTIFTKRVTELKIFTKSLKQYLEHTIIFYLNFFSRLFCSMYFSFFLCGYFPLSFFSSFFKNYVCRKFLLIKSISSCYTSVGGTLSSGSACPFIALLIWPLERQSPFAFSFDFNFLASTVGVSSSVGFL